MTILRARPLVPIVFIHVLRRLACFMLRFCENSTGTMLELVHFLVSTPEVVPQ